MRGENVFSLLLVSLFLSFSKAFLLFGSLNLNSRSISNSLTWSKLFLLKNPEGNSAFRNVRIIPLNLTWPALTPFMLADGYVEIMPEFGFLFLVFEMIFLFKLLMFFRRFTRLFSWGQFCEF